MWNRPMLRRWQRFLGVLLSFCLVLQSSPVLAAGQGAPRINAATPPRPQQPPRSPGYMPDAQPGATPADDALIVERTELIGTADDSDLAFFALETKPADSAVFVEFERHFTAVVSRTVGMLEPGMFLQGLHEVRLCAEDSWGNRACTPARRYDLSSQRHADAE